MVGTKIDLTASATVEADTITKLKSTLKLEARMIAYDMIHRTSYRKLRLAVVARDRNLAFEKSIGIVRG
jgi:acyl transferase domain-containing protein